MKNHQILDNMTENSVTELPATPQYDLENGCQAGEGSCFKQSASEQVSGCLSNEKAIDKFQPTSENIQNEPVEVNDVKDQMQLVLAQVTLPQCDYRNGCQAGEGSFFKQIAAEQVSGCLSNEKSIDKFQPTTENIQNEPVEVNDVKDQMQLIPAQVTLSNGDEQLDPPSADVGKSTTSDCLGGKSGRATHNQLGRRKKITSKSLKKKYMLRSLYCNDRVLRSKTREKTEAPESNSNLANFRNDVENSRKERKKKKKKKPGEQMADGFSRIRAHLKYFLNRVSYEQSLIDAYSGEGWKGYSIDKLKPEKELQRAKAEILRRKFKIRDLFRHLDTLCAEGKLPESLFDSDGEIDSEDIFCSKCGSKDLSTDNDIILCDGACDRGFHQLCLEPPLLTENIPPDNESWLCPGCDCKDDCIELLNESFGMNLSIGDTWERIFPEAAAAAGNNVDHNSGLPSEDSDDDDYNPDVSEDKEIKGDESNFDESEYASASESEYASASEKLENSRNEDQYLGLPSDDSEDDDYDPNALNLDKKINEESSSSDFTSDSEDLATTIKDNMFSEQDEDPLSTSLGDSKQFKGSGRQRGKAGKKQTLADELSSLLESDPGQEGSSPISAKRNVERLDYKKLYDETYQNTESDTSDDEDWTDNATASRRKKLTCKVTPVSTNGKASTVDHTQRETAPSPSRCKRQNKVENTNNTPTKSLEGSRISSSGNKKHGSSTYKKLGEAVVQRLYKSFEENRYPDRATKESLAQELGLTFRQVDKWFTNTRWSHRNSPQTEVGPGRKKVALEQAACCKAENQESLGDKDSDCELVSQECSGEKLKTPSSRKMKREPDPQASDSNLEVVNVTTQPPAGSSGAQVVQKEKGHKMKKRRKKC